jgi:hypothetical protein
MYSKVAFSAAQNLLMQSAAGIVRIEVIQARHDALE